VHHRLGHRLVMREGAQEDGEMDFLQLVSKVALEAEVVESFYFMLAQKLLGETKREFREMVVGIFPPPSSELSRRVWSRTQ
jgi:hypothetical protein